MVMAYLGLGIRVMACLGLGVRVMACLGLGLGLGSGSGLEGEALLRHVAPFGQQLWVGVITR